MIKVLFIDNNEIHSNYKLLDFLPSLPKEMHERALRYRSAEDAYNFVLGRLMLKEALMVSNLYTNEKLSTIEYNENDKPFIEGMHFSLSHTQNWVVCAFSKTHPIGADIEFQKPIEINHLRQSFDEIEWNTITTADNPLQHLYLYWTRKEAVLKAIGKGLKSLKDIHVVDLSKAKYLDTYWYFKELLFDEKVIGVVCSEEEEVEIEVYPFESY